MDGAEIAKILRGQLSKVADKLGEKGEDVVTVNAMQMALRDPWICTLSPDDPNIYRWYNTETGEWGGQCVPS